MIVNPHTIYYWEYLRGAGDVIAVNQPPIVDVEEVFNGRLSFE